MADIYLGISGSEIKLPVIRAIGGAVPDEEVHPNKVIEKATASDGSSIYGLFETENEWSIEWGFLSYAEFQILKGLAALNQELRFQDNRESSTWYNVIVISFTSIKLSGISSESTRWYSAKMVLAEVL